ncbi:MAG: hypothetical protein H6Q67_1406 [Firmicutes bacterium]|nr:hypothetical protein [Bacillota bacterium]
MRTQLNYLLDLTLVAAKNTSKGYIGIEEEKGYWSIAVDRLTA